MLISASKIARPEHLVLLAVVVVALAGFGLYAYYRRNRDEEDR